MSPRTGSLLLLLLFCAGCAAVSLTTADLTEDEKVLPGIFVPLEKRGMCPADVLYPKCENPILGLKHECKLDRDCDGKKKCCFSGCRRRCLLPLAVKKGLCPYFNNTKCMYIKPLPAECDSDKQCQGTERCCYYGCRNQCKATVKGIFVPLVKPGMCPADVLYPKCENSMLGFKHECNLDRDCDGTRKCCFSGCRRRCLLPLDDKNDACPYFNNTQCMHIKPGPPECDNDIQCQGTERCCHYYCRPQCTTTVKVKPGECPITAAKCSFPPPPPLCKSDSECKGKKKCCTKLCQKECTDPKP